MVLINLVFQSRYLETLKLFCPAYFAMGGDPPHSTFSNFHDLVVDLIKKMTKSKKNIKLKTKNEILIVFCNFTESRGY